ncbi:Hsp20/alpha crystallin family protein [Natroniella sulfidigena]|uniref:Hsp20/alpha crystallin family protein n=1 Tax=Natroniella sulfidigena TaxID=723921 RepID=UPI00200B01E1|nr:Hsp20/alpha crystallin family protein [Natroniella sulfidigena]MCK8816692.1 Hsp20/alpha crystallin family protein [Natroniella sulfidigena]
MVDFDLQSSENKYLTGVSSYMKPKYITPQVDILEDKEQIYYIYQLPGIEEKDLNVELSTDKVFIMAESKDYKEKEILHQESTRGIFFRELSLPLQVEVDAAEANFKAGLLEVTFPKIKKS